MRTLEQERAADALRCVRDLKYNGSATFQKEYRSYVDSLGPAIIMNGLGQALATEKAGKGAHKILYCNVSHWLCRSRSAVYRKCHNDALEGIMDGQQEQYILAQAEALAWLQWHKKFCRASFPKGEED